MAYMRVYGQDSGPERPDKALNVILFIAKLIFLRPFSIFSVWNHL